MNFSAEESKENDLIIKAAIRNFLFSLTLQVVRLNNQGAPLLGLAKSIYYMSKWNRPESTDMVRRQSLSIP